MFGSDEAKNYIFLINKESPHADISIQPSSTHSYIVFDPSDPQSNLPVDPGKLKQNENMIIIEHDNYADA